MSVKRSSASLFIFICLFAASAFGETKTWTGAGTNPLWSNPANWDRGVPVNGDSLVFPAVTLNPGNVVPIPPQSSTNDLNALAVASIFVGNTQTWTGNRVFLGAGGISVEGELHSSLPVTLTASQTWEFATTVLGASFRSALAGSIDLGANSLEIHQFANRFSSSWVSVSGDISGSGGLRLHDDPFVTAVFTTPLSLMTISGRINIGGALTFDGVHSEFDLTNADTVGGIAGSATSVRIVQTLDVSGASSATFGGNLDGTASFALNGGTQTFSGANISVPVAVQTGKLILSGTQLSGSLNVTHGTLQLVPTFAPLNGANQIALDSTSTFQIPIGAIFGAPPPTLLRLNGTANLGNSSLVLTKGTDFSLYHPALGDIVPIITSAASSSITGTFAGLPEGGSVSIGGITFKITYAGGVSGKDVLLTVSSLATAVTLTTSSNPISEGAPLTLTADVSVTQGSGAPVGSVTFYDGATALGTISVSSSGRAAFTTSALSAGTHALKAVFTGASGYEPSASPTLSQVITPSPVTVTILSSFPNPAFVGQPITFIAIVTAGALIPSGNVQFMNGTQVIATVPLDASGRAGIRTALPAGTHSITASYLGGSGFLPSTSPAVVQIVRDLIATQTTLSVSPASSHEGQSIVLTAMVSATSGAPGGLVMFSDGATALGSAPLDQSGRAELTISTLATGVHSLTAFYGGGGAYSPSISAAVLLEVHATPQKRRAVKR
ncbi:MAG TPA: Ig-like domain-containing protein [Thermoanaerobaculia bacterium]|jgi:hypothetical protein